MQQYLPFTVLKQDMKDGLPITYSKLQQYLPFTVLKLVIFQIGYLIRPVATVLTVYGIETRKYFQEYASP